MIKKIIGIFLAFLTFVLLFFVAGFIILSLVPDYKFNFFVSLILLISLSFISKKVYHLIANFREDKKVIINNSKKESDIGDNYEILDINYEKPGFPLKKSRYDDENN